MWIYRVPPFRIFLPTPSLAFAKDTSGSSLLSSADWDSDVAHGAGADGAEATDPEFNCR
jgi:hypothetical protein